MAQHYGAAPVLYSPEDGDGPPKRKRLNSLALLECILLPWGIFVGTLWLLSFSVHYDHQEVTYFLLACGLSVAPGLALKWYMHLGAVEHSWWLYLSAASLVAWLMGVVLGSSNFSSNMRPYYELSAMGLARGVDPRASPGNQYLDAGRLIFREGSHIQQDLALGYKDGNTYCAAPVVYGSNASVASFDYWAVGVDCCVAVPPASFWCGDGALDSESHAALRWTGARDNFMRAIEMAEAEYKIKAGKTPLLLTWSQDPVARTQERRAAGVRFFHACTWVYLVLQAVAFFVLAGCYWRLYIYGRLP